MPTTVTGAGILFNDGTSQLTAAGAPTTAQVLAATAAASTNGVGTYALAVRVVNASSFESGLYAGSELRFASGQTIIRHDSYGGTAVIDPVGGALAGTWRAMGRAQQFSTFDDIRYGSTLFLRIS